VPRRPTDAPDPGGPEPGASATRWTCVLGPLWVRAAAVAHGYQRSLAVINGSDEPQVIGPSAHPAGSMQTGDSDCGPESRGGKAVRAYRAQKRAPRPTPRGFSFVKQGCLGPSPAVGVA
jgi:hypothetical protein